MVNDEGSPNDPMMIAANRFLHISDFVILSAFGIRHSAFWL
jgi:hypothetical protein